jgi:hypothetical protein
MKLKVDRWIDNGRYSPEVTFLFQESTRCYKASAYRAALLFSYLAFLTILKERILSAPPPDGFTPPHWEKIRKDLQQDGGWDSAVFDMTKQKKPNTIFIISDDLREQIEYWKNRRNDCAHFKSNDIDYYHVESFWAFIESNLGKLVVSGSIESLLIKVKIHFDNSLTQPDSDPTALIQEINRTVEHPNYLSFYQSITNTIEQLHGKNSAELEKFFDNILSAGLDPSSTMLARFLESEDEKLLTFLQSYPKHITQFKLSPTFIRSLWYKSLFLVTYVNHWPLYTALLRNGLISESDRNEAHEKIILRGTNNWLPQEYEKDELIKANFFDVFNKFVFEENNINIFDWANKNAKLIVYSLENFPLTEMIVKAISNSFSSCNHAYKLCAELENLFGANSNKKSEFLELATSLDIDLPQSIPTLTN